MRVNMVMRYGFSERLGLWCTAPIPVKPSWAATWRRGRNYSEEVASEIDAEIREMLVEAFETARAMLEKHMDRLQLWREELEAREKLTGGRVPYSYGGRKLGAYGRKRGERKSGTTG